MNDLIFGGLRITTLSAAVPPLEGAPMLLPPFVPSVRTCCGVSSVPTLLFDPKPHVREDAIRGLKSDSKRLGLTAEEIEVVIQRSAQCPREVPGLHWPDAISTLSAARTLLDVLPTNHDWLVLGTGMEQSVAFEFLDLPSKETAKTPEGSFRDTLGRKLGMPSGGHFLGFELLTLDSEIGFDCSGFCCRVEQKVSQILGIRPNAHGLIEDVNDARLAATRTTEEGWGEPLRHWPVALFDYTQTVRGAK